MKNLIAWSKYIILVWTVSLLFWIRPATMPIYAQESKSGADSTVVMPEVASTVNPVQIALAGSDRDQNLELDQILIGMGIDSETRYHLLMIAYYESHLEASVEPQTWVKHCFTGSGYVAGEINEFGGQYRCEDYGYTETKREKSFGLWQILQSTANGYGCDVDWKESIENQAECALKVLEAGSVWQWSTANNYPF